jgi:hypothetical protein
MSRCVEYELRFRLLHEGVLRSVSVRHGKIGTIMKVYRSYSCVGLIAWGAYPLRF